MTYFDVDVLKVLDQRIWKMVKVLIGVPIRWFWGTYGQESPGWISLFKIVTFLYTETSMFLVKLIGQWIRDGGGRGITRDIKKSYFNFQNSTKKVTKLGQFTQLGSFSTFQLFKLSKLCYHFLSRFENGNNFFLYP